MGLSNPAAAGAPATHDHSSAAQGGTGPIPAASLVLTDRVPTTRTVSGGGGLTGGGDLTADRTISLGIGGLTAETTVAPAADYVAMLDATGPAHRKVLIQDILASTLASLLQGYSNLRVVVNATNPTYQVDVDADAVVLWDGTNGKMFRAVDKTADITVAGADGLDTGAEASSTIYYVWIVGKSDGTVASLLSTSATAPSMPTGYTYKKLVSWVRNNGSSNFLAFTQQNDFYQYDLAQEVFNGGAAASSTLLSIASFLPADLCRMGLFSTQIQTGGGASDLILQRGDTPDTVNDAAAYCFSQGGTSWYAWCPLDSSGQIRQFKSTGSATIIIRASGGRLRL